MRTFQAPNLTRVNRVRFTPDARTLSGVPVRGSDVIHFDLTDSGCRMWELRESHTDVAYSSDGGLVATAAYAGMVRVYSRTKRVLETESVRPYRHVEFAALAELPGGVADWNRYVPRRVVFAPTTDTRRARLGVTGREFTLWNPHTQEYIVAPEEGDYRGVSFDSDGLTVTSIEYHAHALCVWLVKPFRVLFRTDLKGIDAFDNGSVAMMPDGARVILAAGNVLRCVPIHGGVGWDTATKKPPLEIALHPSGRMLLVADGSKKVTAYDTSNGKAAAQFDWGIGKVGCVTYSPDGTLAAAGGEKGQVVVWDAE
jgi:WD40 repeat protein